MRHRVTFFATASAAMAFATAAVAQSTIPNIRPVQIAPATPPKVAVIIPRIEQARDIVQIAPVVAPPALRDTLAVPSLRSRVERTSE